MPLPGLAPLAAALILAGGTNARADVTPAAGNQSLGTQVIIPANCGTSCVLQITGGTRAGPNLFHRFQNFDTRPISESTNPPISGVTFQNGLSSDAAANVIVGVLSPSHISIPINLQSPASLFWLSPAGITISGNGSFSNLNSLTLSTASGLKLASEVVGSQTFDAIQTTAADIETLNLSGTPITGQAGLSTNPDSLNGLDPTLNSNGNIVLQGGLLTVDQSLLVDAQAGNVQISSASLSGSSLMLRGQADQSNGIGIAISNSQLTAGTSGLTINSSTGGLELGGTFQSESSIQLQSSQGVRLTRRTRISATACSECSEDALVVAAGDGPFINEAGRSAFSVSNRGRWLIYANSPGGTTLGGLAINFKQYGKTFGDELQILGSSSDNGLLYGEIPTISVSLADIRKVNISKVYDGTASAIIGSENLQVSGALDGDVVVVNATGSYTTPGSSPVINAGPEDVGTGKTVVAEASLGSVSSSNAQGAVPVFGYQLNSESSTISTSSGSISPAQLTLSGLVALNKTYDATTNAVLSGTPTAPPPSGDVVSVEGTPTGSFADRNVGIGKPVTISGLTLTGADSGNYILLQAGGLAADISPLPLTAAFTAANKIYDGSTTALISTRTLTGAISDDAVTLTGGNASFADRNVGSAKSVSASGFSLTGSDAPNYSLSNSLPQAFANISPLPLTAAFTAANKVYDGSTTALISTRTLTGAISGDAVTLSGGNASFADRNVGSAKSVFASGFSLTGADAPNYSLSNSLPQAFANISPLPLTAAFTAANKVYDGSTTALISTRTLTGAISGDAVTLSGGNASFADRNVGSAKSVFASGFSLTGADAPNYSLSNSLPQAFADITVRALSTWQSRSGGNWSDAANWDALPVGNNVAAVLIPASSGPVVFDTSVGPTNLQSLTNQGSLALSAAGLTAGQLFNSGSLTLTTALNLRGLSGQNTFTQTGGNLAGPATLNILAGLSSWSGGSWSGGGQVVLSPGASLTIEGASSQWAGRTLVVQAARDGSTAAALTITGTTTAVAGSNTIDNRGLTALNEAALSSSGGTLQLNNSGRLSSSGSTRVDAEVNNSQGNIQVTSGSLLLNGDGRDSAGSAQVDDGAELVWSGGNRTLLGGTRYSGSGSGRFRLAGATLTATDPTPLVFDGQLLVDSGSLSGTGSLAINGGYRQSGGQLSGFSSVAINQPSGLLQIRGSSRDQASIITAPGGSIGLTAQAGSIAVNNTGLDARGRTVGGSILFEAASSILIEGAALLTSGSATGGTITIGNANTPPVLTTIRNSNLVADPPTAGGVINIYGQSIMIEGSTLNLFGDSGGSLIAGNTQTSQLSIDSNTRIIAGPGASITCSTRSACAPPPTQRPTPVEQALAKEGAAVVLTQSVSQSPLSNDAQTSSRVQQPPIPLNAAIGGGSAERNPLGVNLDQASSLSMVQQGRTQNSPASAAQPQLGVRTVSTVSSTETREDFNSGTARSQQETARALGLSETDHQPPPSIEDLQKAMQQITQWIRTRQKNAQESHRLCGGEGQQKCPS